MSRSGSLAANAAKTCVCLCGSKPVDVGDQKSFELAYERREAVGRVDQYYVGKGGSAMGIVFVS